MYNRFILGFEFTIQNVPIKFEKCWRFIQHKRTFTIQNVPIKSDNNEYYGIGFIHLQYKMFLLN